MKSIPYNAILSLLLFLIVIFIAECKIKLAIILAIYYFYLLFDEYINQILKRWRVKYTKKIKTMDLVIKKEILKEENLDKEFK